MQGATFVAPDMSTPLEYSLSRRERQIMDVLIELGEAPAEEVRKRLPEAPSYSAVRAMLAKLEAKGHIQHTERDLRYVYAPAAPAGEARDSAVQRLVRVFFKGSVGQAVVGLVDSGEDLSEEELDRIATAIAAARARRDRS